MRITGGVYRGRRIVCPPGIIRPAMDKMREALFSMLGPLEQCSFLDLFSGSGIVGIEAASRGADEVHLVEMDHQKKRTIENNIRFVTAPIKLYIASSQGFIRRCRRTYDVVYADPPYSMGNKPQLLQLIRDRDIIPPGGLFIIHHPVKELWEEEFPPFRCIDVRTYGRHSALKFFRNESE